MGSPEQAEYLCGRKSRRIKGGCEADRTKVGKLAIWLSRKAAIDFYKPVPETDTGGWGENPKAGGRSIAKELGKMAP